MSPDLKTEKYLNKKNKIISAIKESLEEQWDRNLDLEDGTIEVWIDKDLNLKAPSDSYEGFVMIHDPYRFSFNKMDVKELEVARYQISEYLTDVLGDIDSVDIADELLYSYSLENYWEED